MDANDTRTKKRILIVDDEYSIRESLKMLFEGKGFSTSQAANGAEALDMVEKEDFDAIISDIRMEKMDGVALIKKLRQSDKSTPVIFMTAYPELDNAVEAIRNGVVEYIIKPFDMGMVSEKVDTVIKARDKSSEGRYNRLYKEQQQKFLSRFSHELRTPLTPIVGYLTLLLKKEFGELPRQQIEIIQNIARNSDRLKSMTDDITLLYSVENAGEPMSVKKTGIQALIEEAMKPCREQLKDRGLTVDVRVFDSLESAYCDHKKLARAVFHLLDNAIKFSPEGSTIGVTARKYSYDGNDFVKFTVSDRGSGISGVDKRAVFQQFYNVNKYGDDFEVNKAVKGLGIGLTLAKAVIEAHCGKVWVEDNQGTGKGSVFSFIIPLI